MGKTPRQKNERTGIRLNHLNIVFIAAGLIIAVLMVYSMYQTTDRFGKIVDVTEAYLSSQQTTGMLKDISEGMSETCGEFLQTGTPDAAYSFNGKLGEINKQLAADEEYNDPDEDEYMRSAVEAFRHKTAMEIHAMRLKAETMPMAIEAYPEFIQKEELNEAEQAMTLDEKQKKAEEIIGSEEYQSYRKTIDSAVDDSHRMGSERGKADANKTSQEVSRIIRFQKIMIFLFVLIAILALLFNRFLIIRPIQKSADNLDQREPLPVQGSYEVRHLARVYNDVLKENKAKTEALSYTATHDALTGVYNRAAFDEFYRAQENTRSGVIIVDVDLFKHYNDENGHDVGDQVLKAVADKLKEHFRAKDMVCRIGGDEFCIIIPDTMHAQGDAIVRKIQSINDELAKSEEGLPSISISAGVAYWNRPNPSGDLLKDADSMLLEVKKGNRGSCLVYPG